MGKDEYNILVVDGKTKLLSDIDYDESIDPEKKCMVVVYCDDNMFQPVHMEYEHPSLEEDMKNLLSNHPCPLIKSKSHETYERIQ